MATTLNTLNDVPAGLISLLKERFWKRVQKTGSCWLWSGSYCEGYGLFSFTFEGVVYQFRAHKAAWLLHKGDIGNDQGVLHDCQRYNGLGDVRGCVNPEHLKLGSRGDNSRDWRIKGPSPIPRLTTTEANRLWPKPISDWERRSRERQQRQGSWPTVLSDIADWNLKCERRRRHENTDPYGKGPVNLNLQTNAVKNSNDGVYDVVVFVLAAPDNAVWRRVGVGKGTARVPISTITEGETG